MAKQSKARSYYQTIRAEREAWKQRFELDGRCWVCRKPWQIVVHEMAKRSQAPNRWGELCNYFLCCNPCNCGVLESARVEWQLALKLLYDAPHYDRRRVNELRGRAPDAVSAEDVESCLQQLLKWQWDYGTDSVDVFLKRVH